MSIFDEVMSGELRYGGFVYVDTSDSKPSFYHVNIASMMFDKKQLKQTRTLNPLFAQEHDATVEIVASGGNLRVMSKDKQRQMILEIPLKKLALVSVVDKAVYCVVLRAKGDKYLCHRFQAKNAKAATELSMSLNDLITKAASVPDIPVFGADNNNDDEDYEEEVANNNNDDVDHYGSDDNDEDQDGQGLPMMQMLSKQARQDSQENSSDLPLMRMLSKKNRKGSEPIVEQSALDDMAPIREALYEDLPEPVPSRNERDNGYLEPKKLMGNNQITEDIYSEPPNPAPRRTQSHSASVIFRGGVPLNPPPPPRSPGGPTRSNTVGSTSTLQRPRMPVPSGGGGGGPRHIPRDTFRTSEYYFDFLSRREAESRLRDEPPGTFMIRLAESHQGYALSMTLFDGSVQHFKVWQDQEDKFRIAGNEGRGFGTLTDLVEHYRWSPITNSGDFCVRACPRLPSDPNVYEATIAEN